MQKYISQPREDGKYCVMAKNLLTEELAEMRGEVYFTEAEARQRAEKLNEEYNEELKEDVDNQNNNQNPKQNENND